MRMREAHAKRLPGGGFSVAKVAQGKDRPMRELLVLCLEPFWRLKKPARQGHCLKKAALAQRELPFSHSY